ncbi:TOBE domain-containing protein [Paracandidimonas soli]|uniref:TOBE domain-containing protein n=1 Tax=Paracandidimonas soli TaxID=1917182 RepID=UPI003340D1F6
MKKKEETDDSLQLEGSIWFRSGQQNWGNPRRMALLAAIDSQGSITGAAKHVGLSYKAAWDAVDAMNNLAGEPLVQRTTGGQRGGGARLTERARELLELYQSLSHEHERFVAKLAAIESSHSRNLELIQHMMFQVSIRNKLTCAVESIAGGKVNSVVTLALGDALRIRASITQASVHNLRLEPGRRVIALIKASSLAFGLPDRKKPKAGQNRVSGRVSNIVLDDSYAEVQLSLDEGRTLTGTIPRADFDKLGLEEGDQAVALFEESNVMLGVLD